MATKNLLRIAHEKLQNSNHEDFKTVGVELTPSEMDELISKVPDSVMGLMMRHGLDNPELVIEPILVDGIKLNPDVIALLVFYRLKRVEEALDKSMMVRFKK